MEHDIQKFLIKKLRYIHINNKNYTKHHNLVERLQATLLFPLSCLELPEIQQYNGGEMIILVVSPIFWVHSALKRQSILT